MEERKDRPRREIFTLDIQQSRHLKNFHLLTLDAQLEGGVCDWRVSGICVGMCVIQWGGGGWPDWK